MSTSRVRSADAPTKPVLIRALTEGYRGPAWHGPSVRSVLQGIGHEQAHARLHPERNSIWEVVLHLAYARHRALLHLVKENGGKGERFPRPLRKSWWPALPDRRTPDTWKEDRQLLDEYQRRLIKGIEECPDELLTLHRGKKKWPLGTEIFGVAVHDAYHAGQIRLTALAQDSIGLP